MEGDFGVGFDEERLSLGEGGRDGRMIAEALRGGDGFLCVSGADGHVAASA